jgi:hypothetical protein
MLENQPWVTNTEPLSEPPIIKKSYGTCPQCGWEHTVIFNEGCPLDTIPVKIKCVKCGAMITKGVETVKTKSMLVWRPIDQSLCNETKEIFKRLFFHDTDTTHFIQLTIQELKVLEAIHYTTDSEDVEKDMNILINAVTNNGKIEVGIIPEADYLNMSSEASFVDEIDEEYEEYDYTDDSRR